MGFYVAKQTVKKIIKAEKNVINSKVLIMGATFKENVSDIRNSKVANIVSELQTYGVYVDVTDPYACSEQLKKLYGFSLTENIDNNYDAVIIAVNHNEYINLDESYFKSISSDKAILIDLKGIYRNKIKNITYWSL